MRSGLRFVFLQGPHGPFFGQLATQLAAAGNAVSRIGFNRGDEAAWPRQLSYNGFYGLIDDWSDVFRSYLIEHGISDVVVYGDGRPLHSIAKSIVSELGLTLHCFEEGYLRPYWITYERGGSNGNSRLMDMSVEQIRRLVSGKSIELKSAPAHWGSMWHHTWHGCLYHGQILFRNRSYPHYRSHRNVSIASEWRLHSIRLALMPLNMWRRNLATRKLLQSGTPYHLVLLQLGHDSAVADHSDFATMQQFMRTNAAEFAINAAPNEILVFKAHPLEDGAESLRRVARRLAMKFGLNDRLLFLDGGNLGPLLDSAKSVVTINSTAGQQALWRGLPLKTLGQSVYGKPEFVSAQVLGEFFRNPTAPDAKAYRDFRAYLLNTSQVSGNFYMASGRARILRRAVPLIMALGDPYDEFAKSEHDGVSPDPAY